MKVTKEIRYKDENGNIQKYDIGALSENIEYTNPNHPNVKSAKQALDMALNTSNGIPLANCTDISIVEEAGRLTIKWKDPNDTVAGDTTIAEWAYTKLVRKEGSYPTDVNDGIFVVSNSIRNQYQTNGYTDAGLTSGTKYYYKLFPVSTAGTINTNEENNISGTPARTVIPAIPSQNGSLTYTGGSQIPNWLDYDNSQLTIGGVTSGVDAGTYSATFTPLPGYEWDDGSADAKEVAWTIGRATIASIPSQSGSLTYTGSSLSPSWNNYNSSQLTIGGTTSSTNAGSYNATFTPKSNYKWSDGTTTAKTVSWSIAKAAGSLSISPASLALNSTNPSGTIAVTRTGNGTISATSSNTSVATVSVSGTTVTVNNVNKKDGTATITVKVAAGTNHNAPADKTCSVTASFIPAVLRNATAAQIAAASESGKAKELWSVGDEWDVTLADGEFLTLQIYDFDHDDLADGSGKAGITFGMKNLMATVRKMNASNTNVNGFTGSEMYTWLQGELYNLLPADLRGVIKSVYKKTSAGNKSPTINTNAMKIFLPSEKEYFGTAAYSYDGEGTQYPIFTDNNSRIKRLSNGAGSASYIWTRSPRKDYTTAFCLLTGDGTNNPNINHCAASQSRGVGFAFCV